MEPETVITFLCGMLAGVLSIVAILIICGALLIA
jgi:hypothetical protein